MMLSNQQTNGRPAISEAATPRELLDFYLREHPHDVAVAITVMIMELSSRIAALETAVKQLQSAKR